MTDARYQKMRELLAEEENYPLQYTFKFIVPSLEVPQLISYLGEGFLTKTKPSSKGKYVSVSATKSMESADAIIAVYKKMESIKGVIAL